MKDLMKLAAEVMADFSAMKIRYRPVRNWIVGTDKKTRWGYCETVGQNLFDIHIAERLLWDDVDDQDTKNTLAHELLHTVEGCMNHKWYWQKLAAIIHTRMPQYVIERTLDPEKIGIHVERKEPVYRYFFRCKGCGNEIKYQKNSKFVQHYERYYCRLCGDQFEKIEKKE